MDTAPNVGRRKACDNCFKRKIRCDQAKPVCSNCALYQTDCKTTVVRRRPAVPTKTTPLHSERADLNSPPAARSVDTSFSTSSLPPLDDIIIIVERYFNYANSQVPLFDKDDFSKTLLAWLSPSLFSSSLNPNLDVSSPESRKAISAAINVVLALSYRIPQPHAESGGNISDENPLLQKSLDAAEATLPSLVRGNEDFLSLQVILGIILVHLQSADQQPATILIGAAVQLCHRLRLASQDENVKFPPGMKLMRERLFWITYILEKDISIRYHTPPLIAEEDIDIERLPQNSPDGIGIVPSLELAEPFDLFVHRAHLAQIAGQVYDQLFSARARVTTEQRQARVYLLDASLENWRRNIPDSFQASRCLETITQAYAVSGAGNTTEVEYKRNGALARIAEMHFAYMGLLVRIHGLWSDESTWQGLLSSEGRQAVRDSAPPGSKCGAQRPYVSRQWERCTMRARDCLALAHDTQDGLGVWDIWSTGCAYTSSLVVLLANLCDGDDLDHIEIDRRLSRHGLQVIDKMRGASNWTPLHQLAAMLAELDLKAEIRLNQA